MQYTLVRQYLWVATAIIGGACALLARAAEMHLHGAVFVAYIAVIALAYVAFVMALTTAKGTGYDAWPYRGSLTHYEEQARTYSTASVKVGMFELLCEGITQSYGVVTKRAMRMRWVCRILVVASFVLLLAAGFAEYEVWYGGK